MVGDCGGGKDEWFCVLCGVLLGKKGANGHSHSRRGEVYFRWRHFALLTGPFPIKSDTALPG